MSIIIFHLKEDPKAVKIMKWRPKCKVQMDPHNNCIILLYIERVRVSCALTSCMTVCIVATAIDRRLISLMLTVIKTIT